MVCRGEAGYLLLDRAGFGVIRRCVNPGGRVPFCPAGGDSGAALFSAGWGGGLGSILGSIGSSYLSGGSRVAKLQEAVEIFDGATMEAFGLGLKAQKRGGDVGLPGEHIEAVGEPVGASLFEGDVDAFGELGAIEDGWIGGAATAWSKLS